MQLQKHHLPPMKVLVMFLLSSVFSHSVKKQLVTLPSLKKTRINVLKLSLYQEKNIVIIYCLHYTGFHNVLGAVQRQQNTFPI